MELLIVLLISLAFVGLLLGTLAWAASNHKPKSTMHPPLPRVQQATPLTKRRRTQHRMHHVSRRARTWPSYK